jgi:hypothetical protein
MDHLAYRLRITQTGPDAARVLVRRHQFTVGRPVAFDAESSVTALECALGALGAELVTGLRLFAKRRRLMLDAVESVVEGQLDRPLAFLEVVGEAGPPRLGRVAIKVFVASPHDEPTIRQLWADTLERLPLTGTFMRALDLQIELAHTG